MQSSVAEALKVEESKDNQATADESAVDAPRKMKGPRPKGLKKFKPVI